MKNSKLFDSSESIWFDAINDNYKVFDSKKTKVSLHKSNFNF